ncbi:hypothetical protein [Paraburkholderia caribensis]|uniref:hypothetical protein n=1 Tax=Paraburkholderia caribensis TaxID=75105 RepID=UPI0020918F38|nr:hypothetical protein [Paraburkholderia caribensis]MCO4879058.1 hypothetical protein [Paraburkholderia caribensis]
MAFFPIDLPPGVMANGSLYQSKGRWRQADMVRWYEGHMRPVGGWQRFTASPLSEPARALLTWRANTSLPYAAVGTANHLLTTSGGVFTDLTPTDLAKGTVDAYIGDGFGTGLYSDESYGTARTGNTKITGATTWSLDNFGQILLALQTNDGRLFEWDPSTTATKATLVPNAPTDAVAMFVTAERMVVMLGVGGNAREVAWSNQGDFTQWTVDETTTAGDLQLHTNGIPICGIRMPGTNLIFTDTDVHSLNYVGYPYIYGTNLLSSNCGLIAPKAVAATTNFAVWMGNKNFYLYNGTVQAMPSDVAEAVFNNLNTTQKSKVCAGINSTFSEVWWFFPSTNSTENDSYCYWNFKDNHWGFGLGVFGRTAWSDREVWPYPIGAGSDYNLYEQENGWTDAGKTRVGSYTAISGPIDLGPGDTVMTVTQILPDTNDGTGGYDLNFITRNTPNGPETTWGPYSMRPDDGYMDCRFTGRQVQLQVTPTVDGLIQIGAFRLNTKSGGKR